MLNPQFPHMRILALLNAGTVRKGKIGPFFLKQNYAGVDIYLLGCRQSVPPFTELISEQHIPFL